MNGKIPAFVEWMRTIKWVPPWPWKPPYGEVYIYIETMEKPIWLKIIQNPSITFHDFRSTFSGEIHGFFEGNGP